MTESNFSFLRKLKPCNVSDPDAAVYNFSSETAMKLILEYRDKMMTIRSPATIALLCLYTLTFVFALGSNVLVIYVVFKNSHMRKVKNMFLVNLAFSDLMVTTLCIPMATGQSVYRLWIYGALMCKISDYIQGEFTISYTSNCSRTTLPKTGFAVACSIFTLATLSIDRCLAVTHHKSKCRLSSKRPSVYALVIIWVLAGASAGPLLFVRKTTSVSFDCLDVQFAYCIEQWPSDVSRQLYAILVIIMIYAVPLAIVAVCYGFIGRTLCSETFPGKHLDDHELMLSRKRVTRMLIALVLLFVICWLPYNICSTKLDFIPNMTESTIYPFTLWLGHAHSVVNPTVYWFMDKRFRHCMRKALCCWSKSATKKHRTTPPSTCNLGAILRYKCSSRSPNRDIEVKDPEQFNENPEQSIWFRRRHRDHGRNTHRGDISGRGGITDTRALVIHGRRNPHAPKAEGPAAMERQSVIPTATTTSVHLMPTIETLNSRSPRTIRMARMKPDSISPDTSTQPTSPSTDYIEQYGLCTMRSVQV